MKHLITLQRHLQNERGMPDPCPLSWTTAILVGPKLETTLPYFKEISCCSLKDILTPLPRIPLLSSPKSDQPLTGLLRPTSPDILPLLRATYPPKNFSGGCWQHRVPGCAINSLTLQPVLFCIFWILFVVGCFLLDRMRLLSPVSNPMAFSAPILLPVEPCST